MDPSSIVDIYNSAVSSFRASNDTAGRPKFVVTEESRRVNADALRQAVDEAFEIIMNGIDLSVVPVQAEAGATKATVFSTSGVAKKSMNVPSVDNPGTFIVTRDYTFSFLVRGPLRGRLTGSAFWAAYDVKPLTARIRDALKPFATHIQISQGKLDVVVSWATAAKNDPMLPTPQITILK